MSRSDLAVALLRAENYLVVACRRRMHTVVLRGRVSSRASDVAFGPFTVAAGSSTRIRFVVPVAISAGDHTRR